MNNIYNQFGTRQNILPPQQILNANGKASIDMLQMSPNSSVLIADTTAPIVWKCVSDGLGNVTAEPFDILPHKDPVEVERENLAASIKEILERLTALEGRLDEQSVIGSTEGEFTTDFASTADGEQSTGTVGTDGAKQSASKGSNGVRKK